ncbi:porin [Vibrio sp. SCSIO 43135]|uniref:Porin n=1 Tax=Vibrio paucivorans TaxID=2829489 RepID=A0A9X3CBG9_9VIBR|nr:MULTISPECIES: porin [Vibrio]MCW8332659.1 porin [Vibrio paucivorans]USD41858.1 porin [Vibrio sp. SCSIO 43135]
MDKMFKRTLLGATIALASTGVMAKQVGVNSDFTVEAYGVAAISIVNYNTTDNNDSSAGYAVENESRIGFRAHGDMYENFKITMQIESGYVDNTDWSHGGVSGGVLGFRDTYIGASGDWGNVRVGRVLTPLYEIVDWPFSNPGLGSVFDWGGIAAHYDRQSNQVRYDSAKFGGFSFAASVGRDDGANGGGAATRDSSFVSANAKYSFEKVTLMGAVETGSDYNAVAGQDNLTYLVGAEASLPGGFGLAAAYKQEELDGYQGTAGSEISQGSYSIIGQYWNGPLGIKVGYAANLESELNGAKQADSDSNTISGQVMGVINGFVPYVRVAGRTVGSADTDIVTRFGLEYGF